MELTFAREQHLVDKLKTIAETSDEHLLQAVNSVLQHHDHFIFLVHEAISDIRARAERAEAYRSDDENRVVAINAAAKPRKTD
jgi:5-carboxymethyl-2-hydroxymuconate isomerase